MFKTFAIAALTLAFADARPQRELTGGEYLDRLCNKFCDEVVEDEFVK